MHGSSYTLETSLPAIGHINEHIMHACLEQASYARWPLCGCTAPPSAMPLLDGHTYAAPHLRDELRVCTPGAHTRMDGWQVRCRRGGGTHTHTRTQASIVSAE